MTLNQKTPVESQAGEEVVKKLSMISFKSFKPRKPKHFPFAVLSILAVNIGIFYFQATESVELFNLIVYGAGAIPYEIWNLEDIGTKAIVPLPLTILTCIFVHGTVHHLAMNMGFLGYFGVLLEEQLGAKKFFLIYLLTGILSIVIQLLADVTSKAPVVGASGAIAGIIGAIALVFPVKWLRVPIIVMIGALLFLQIIYDKNYSSLGLYAHLGGFIVGIGLMWLMKRGDVNRQLIGQGSAT